jgi:hypothetical protein
VNQLLTEAQVEDRLRRDLLVLADDVADRDGDVWTTAPSPAPRAAWDRRSRRSLPLVAAAAAIVVLGAAIGVALSRHAESGVSREEPASDLPTTIGPNVVRVADQAGTDVELLRLRRIADGAEVTVWRWDGRMGDTPPLEPIGANSGYFAPYPEDPSRGSVILPFGGPTLAGSSFLTISGPVELEGELRNLAAGIVREDDGGQVTYTITVPETYAVTPPTPGRT